MTIFPVAASGILNGPINCVTMLNFVAIGQTVPRYGDFLMFQDGGHCHFAFLKFQTFNGRTAQEGRTASPCQNWSNRGRDVAFFGFFQDGGRPPSWICDACVRTTHEGHLVVFITVQKLFAIYTVGSIICKFYCFTT